MAAVTVLQIGLAAVLVMAAAWRMVKLRANFQTPGRYVSHIVGTLLMLAGVGGALAYARFGYSGHYLEAGAIAACVGIALIFWGTRGYRPQNLDPG